MSSSDAPAPGVRPARRLLGWSLLASLFAAAGGCSTPAATVNPAFGDGRLALSGSSTIAPLVSGIARRFEAANPGVRVDVQTGGSSRGVADARRGTVQIGMVSRALAPEETDLTATPIARDGVALIVHATNRVPSLTGRQIAGIYTGRITNWSAVGSPDAAITVVNMRHRRLWSGEVRV